MGTVTFEGKPPFDLVVETPPTTTAEGESVVVALPVFVDGFPNKTADVRLLLSIPQAEQLARQIQSALLTPQVSRRGR